MQFDEPVVCEGSGCPADPERVQSPQSIKRRLAANSDSRDQLARLAVGTRDPELYGLAYGICATHGREDANSACRMLSADQWARLDSGNGVPWLAVAAEAKARGDRAGVAEALHRVGRGHVDERPHGQPVAAALRAHARRRAAARDRSSS